MTDPTLPPDTAMGPVTLRVRDPGGALGFWRDVLGLDAQPTDGVTTLRSPGDGAALVRLLPAPAAPPRHPSAPGLFHVALRVPDRGALARAFLALRRQGWPLQGASDHRVSEALYLADPEGNGVEIYADRPRASWRWEGGEVAMTTQPLDLPALLRSADPADGGPALCAGTEVGHVHLRVSDLERAEAFWGPAGLGFEVTTRRYPGALFLSAGGYHHHVGLNVWGGRGPAAPDDAAGLAELTVRVPARTHVDAVAGRLAGAATEVVPGRLEARDADGIAVVVEMG